LFSSNFEVKHSPGYITCTTQYYMYYMILKSTPLALSN